MTSSTKSSLICLTIFTLISSSNVHSQSHTDSHKDIVISKDGREINLNKDGTWNYASEDILVETEGGYTARLKPDNTWEYVGNAPIKKETRPISCTI